MSIFEFDDQQGVRTRGTLHAPGATPGDVLTVGTPHGAVSPSPGGGSVPGALQSQDWLFQEAASAASVSHAITAADTVGNTFTIAGDHVAEFPTGICFAVIGSTGNDGTYLVSSASLVGGATVIAVGTVADNHNDGSIEYGLYTASLDLPAASSIYDVMMLPEVVSQADTLFWRALTIIASGDTDNPNAYFDPAEQSGGEILSRAYDALAAQYDVNWLPAASNSDGYSTIGGPGGAGALGLSLQPGPPQPAVFGALPPGVPYPAGTTFTFRIYTAARGGATPLGLLRVRLWYATSTPVANVAIT